MDSMSYIRTTNFTHQSSSARSRLDRIYCNQHVVEQFDRELRVTALDWRKDLSNHRAVGFSRKTPDKAASGRRGVSEAAIKHVDFPCRVKLAWQDSHKDDPNCSSVERLRMLKRAMCTVSDGIAREPSGYVAAQSREEKVGIAMK